MISGFASFFKSRDWEKLFNRCKVVDRSVCPGRVGTYGYYCSDPSCLGFFRMVGDTNNLVKLARSSLRTLLGGAELGKVWQSDPSRILIVFSRLWVGSGNRFIRSTEKLGELLIHILKVRTFDIVKHSLPAQRNLKAFNNNNHV